MAGRFHDWRGVGLDAEVETARTEVRRALGEALAQPPPAPAAWAAAELAVQHGVDLAIDRLYASLGASRPSPAQVPADVAARDPAAGRLVVQVLTAPDTRGRWVFMEDLLGYVAGKAKR